MKTQVKEAPENSKRVLATKEDSYKLRTELKEDIHALRVEMKGDSNSLNVKLEKMRAYMIEWMFIFWIGQIAAILALLRFFSD